MEIDMKSKIIIKSEEDLKCYICNKEFNANDLESHFATVHHEETNSNQKNTCKICLKSYKFKVRLEKHLDRDVKRNLQPKMQ